MPGMTASQVEALGRHVERQGVKVTRTKNGLLLRLPNQDTTMVHYTSSDVNQIHQIRRILSRAGVTMPQEARAHGETRKPSKRSKALVKAEIIALGDPESVTIREIMTAITSKGEVITSGAVSNVLSAWGYAPSGSRQSRRYHRPYRTSLIAPDLQAPESVESVEPRPATPDFVDGVGSRMLDPEMFPDHLSLGDVRAMLSALGLGLQLRVWTLGDDSPVAVRPMPAPVERTPRE